MEVSKPCSERVDQQNQLPDVVHNPNPLCMFADQRTSVPRDSLDSQAVEVDKVCKSFVNAGNGKTTIIKNFSMNVSSGAIYSLLGSSGCGKTTILSCIVGLKHWDSGNITVLGHKRSCTGREGFSEISRCIGYMPQELALYEHLTVNELFRYFGKLYGMVKGDMEERWKFISKLLELTQKRSALIKNLSGGQKRRVSLSLALVHRPQLLILDEPTVGLDPLLRESIWKHLHELVNIQRTTVLITTHFVEETRWSDKIGVMRDGKMLLEDTPASLLATCESNLLQEAIFRICKQDHFSNPNRESRSYISSKSQGNEVSPLVFQLKGRSCTKSFNGVSTNDSENSVVARSFKEANPDNLLRSEMHIPMSLSVDKPSNLCRSAMMMSMSRTVAFSTVIWSYLIRQPIFGFMLLFMPALELVLTFFVVGREPTNLAVGLLNLERLQYEGERNCSQEVPHGVCDLTMLSCRIERDLVGSTNLNMIDIPNSSYGNELIKTGANFGFVQFSSNYSEFLVNRYIYGRFATGNDTLEQSKIGIVLDKSHYLAYNVILNEVLQSLQKMGKGLEKSCGFVGYNEVAFQFSPVYGNSEGTQQGSIMPAIVAQILFEVLYGIAPLILIKDLKEGTLARANLAGLRFSEFMLGMFVAMGPVLVIQSLSCYLVLEYGFHFEVEGSIFLFLLLCLLAGLCGQSFGIFMGMVLKCEFSLIVSAIMVIPIIMTCSGTLWPLEAHPFYLIVIYHIFPSALLVSSLRSVIQRGVGLTHRLVWPGLVNAVSWSIIFWIMSIFIFKRMSK